MSAMNPDGYVSVQRKRLPAEICVFAGATANDVAGQIAGLVSRCNASARLSESGRRLPTSIAGEPGAHHRRAA
jgi:hypothetical protein